MSFDPQWQAPVVAIAHRAAEAILAVYAQQFEVDTKPDASPVTAADLAAHRVIMEGLHALTPHIPVLSEESAHEVPTHTRRAWSRLWLVDPLDGTREFIKRNGEFTVNIAYVEDGSVLWGVIQQPVTGLLWHGGAGLGAWVQHRDGMGHPCCVKPAQSPLRVAVSRSHQDARTARLLAALGEITAANCGSSLKFCQLADGALDLYPRLGPTSEWDTAAGQAILEGAGGAVLLPDGTPLRYNQRSTLLNGDFIALGDATLGWQVAWQAMCEHASKHE